MTRRFARKGDGTLPGSDVASGLRSTGLLRASSESPRRLNPQHSRRLGHPPCQWDGLPFTGLGKETCCSGACDDGAGAAAEISPDASPGSSAPFCLRPCRPKGAGGWCGKWRRPAMCWLRAGERSGGIALILRWRPPAYDHPRRLSRCVLGQPGEPAAELNRSRRLAGLVEGGQDRGQGHSVLAGDRGDSSCKPGPSDPVRDKSRCDVRSGLLRRSRTTTQERVWFGWDSGRSPGSPARRDVMTRPSGCHAASRSRSAPNR